MRITALAENTSFTDSFACEHGLSLYIETGSHKILFDMGQTNLFAENAQKLGLDLSQVDIAVLSHGHYDHGGGLRRFLQLNSKAPVFVSRYAFEPHFNGTEKYIGLDTELKNSDRLIFTDDECRIADRLTLLSCNKRKKLIDFGSANLNVFENGVFCPEDFRHEQYLLIEEGGKRVLVSGCSHKGIVNIAEWFKPDVLLGGFHLMKLAPGELLKENAQRLNTLDTDYYTFHCTGTEQYEYMKQFMQRLNRIRCGQTVCI